MLDEGRRTELLYFLKEIVLDSGVNEKLAEPFMASLAAKGARESVDSAMPRFKDRGRIYSRRHQRSNKKSS